MAFDKNEIKQLEQLFAKERKHTESLFINERKNTRASIKDEFINERKNTRIIVCEALEDLVLPRLQNVEDEVRENSDKLDIIERKVDATIELVDKHDRILKA